MRAEARATIPAVSPAGSTHPFARLGLSQDLVAALKKMGIDEPFPVQELTIPDALAGRDVCGKARTGSGKTLAFGLPLLELTPRSAPRRPHSLILAPTRELANQIAENLSALGRPRGTRVVTVYGGASMNRQVMQLRAGADIVVATPGRLFDLLDRGALAVADVRIVVIDEADQMADFGFLPQVERILDQIEGRHQTLLFSATLSGDVDRLIRRYQHDPVFHEVATEPEEVPTMQHRFVAVANEQKVAVAASIASGPNRTLFFVRTQRGADRLSRLLGREGIEAGILHGGISQPRRERALKAFADGRLPVLVATNIAARGIHVDGVDIVVHFDPPEDSKTYLHRSGRTARAGASGVVVTLVAPDQHQAVNVLRREANLRQAIVPMDATDARLADLEGWQPPMEEARDVRRPAAVQTWNQPQGGRRWRGRPRSSASNNARLRPARVSA